MLSTTAADLSLGRPAPKLKPKTTNGILSRRALSMSLVLLARLRDQQNQKILARRKRDAKMTEVNRQLDAVGAQFNDERSRSESPISASAKIKENNKEDTNFGNLCLQIEATAISNPSSPVASSSKSPAHKNHSNSSGGLLCRGKPTSSPRHSHLYQKTNEFGGGEKFCRFEANHYATRARRQIREPIKLPDLCGKPKPLHQPAHQRLLEMAEKVFRERELLHQQRLNEVLPCGLTQLQVLDLLYRDIDAEDYDVLKILDENVPKKVVSQDVIEMLPKVDFEDLPEGTASCGICLLDFESDDSIKRTLCDHYFHDECISKWLSECNTVCPTCQATCVPEEKTIDE